MSTAGILAYDVSITGIDRRRIASRGDDPQADADLAGNEHELDGPGRLLGRPGRLLGRPGRPRPPP